MKILLIASNRVQEPLPAFPLGVAYLAGNIDPAEAVLRGTPDTIKDAFRQVYETVGNPFMVNAGCEIPSGTPNENLKALCEPIAYAG